MQVEFQMKHHCLGSLVVVYMLIQLTNLLIWSPAAQEKGVSNISSLKYTHRYFKTSLQKQITQVVQKKKLEKNQTDNSSVISGYPLISNTPPYIIFFLFRLDSFSWKINLMVFNCTTKV